MQTLWKNLWRNEKKRKERNKKKVGIGSRHPLSNFVRSHRRCCFVCSTWNYLGKDLCIEARTCARTYRTHTQVRRCTPKTEPSESFLYSWFCCFSIFAAVALFAFNLTSTPHEIEIREFIVRLPRRQFRLRWLCSCHLLLWHSCSDFCKYRWHSVR